MMKCRRQVEPFSFYARSAAVVSTPENSITSKAAVSFSRHDVIVVFPRLDHNESRGIMEFREQKTLTWLI